MTLLNCDVHAGRRGSGPVAQGGDGGVPLRQHGLEVLRDARDVLLIVVVAEAVLSVHLMQQALLVGFGRSTGIGVPQVLGAIAMVVLDLMMIPPWGMLGAAWACLLGYGVLAITSTVWTNRELGKQVL